MTLFACELQEPSQTLDAVFDIRDAAQGYGLSCSLNARAGEGRDGREGQAATRED